MALRTSHPALRTPTALLLLGAAFASRPHGAAAELPAAAPPAFEAVVQPLLQARCTPCHGGDARKAELDLRTADAVLRGGESGPAVVPGKPDESLLLERLHDGSMPPDDAPSGPLNSDEIGQIAAWIAAGAPSTSAPAAPADDAGFAADSFHAVLPILLRHCTPCHGPRFQEADLDLHTYAGLQRGGKSGPVVVPGSPEQSLLWQRLAAAEMPPVDRLMEVSVKPVEAGDREHVRRWIAAGAREGDAEPDVATTETDPLVSDADRAFWAFRPPGDPAPPAGVDGVDGLEAAHPIDAFLRARLAERGLGFAPAAARQELLRRVTFDLTGLPPAPQELRDFLDDADPHAYEKAVDRLLASPAYGERWARIWLDLAGYADSDGKREQDLPRPFAWRYRDYVIRAFNDDKPYDRFLHEQIAGDELADYRGAEEWDEATFDNLVATGFLRMAPDGTWRNVTNFIPDRLEVMSDALDVLGGAVLGLSLKCARCHSHKFDPLPQRDYYRLAAVFKGALDEYDWLKSNWHASLSEGQQLQRQLPCNRADERAAWESHKARVAARIDDLQRAQERRAEEATARLLEQRLADLPAEEQAAVRAAARVPEAERTAAQQQLAVAHRQRLHVDEAALRAFDPDYGEFLDQLGPQLAHLQQTAPPEPQIHALWDRGDPSPTYIYRRGDYLAPGRLVGPGVPSVLTDGRTPFTVTPPWPGAPSTGRRLAFARWLTLPDHPLTARVYVNRIWKHHFGAGIVRTLDDFGRQGSPPSHPELLDWLARDFTAHGWSTKRLHRQIVTSAAYRQSTEASPDALREDPDNVLLSRMPRQRLTADQLHDALLAVADRLDRTRGGPPDAIDRRADGLATPQGGPRGWRRSIYLQQERKVVATALEAFDFPAMNPNCPVRYESTVATQALYLWNDGWVERLAACFAERVAREAGSVPADRVDRAHRLALGRPATSEEIAAETAALAALARAWEAAAGRPAADGDATAAAADQALASWCHALINSAEFLYVD
jgi:hypothetical protein